MELRLAAAERQLQALVARRVELSAAVDAEGPLGLVTRSPNLNRLWQAEEAIKTCEGEAQACRRQLQLSKGRHDAVLERATSLKAKEDRRLLEQDMREVALAMLGKASGKGGMLK